MVKIAHARRDERGKYSGGKPGDQDGKEVCVTDWYCRPWTVVLRPRNRKLGVKIARKAKAIAKNDYAGYCQHTRTTLYKEAEKHNFNISKIDKPCNCDCSSMVATACCAAGVNVPQFSTHYMVAILARTKKFYQYNSKKYTQSPDYLRKGDILVYPGHHTAVVVTDGDKVKAKDKSKKRKTNAEVAKEIYLGRGGWGNEPVRSKKLKAAGYNPKQVQVLVNQMYRKNKK